MQSPAELYKEILENINDIVIQIYIDGTIYYVSPQVHQIIGYYPKELIGVNLFEYIHQADLPPLLDSIRIQHLEGYEISLDLNIRHRKGHFIPVSLKGKMLKSKGKPKLISVLRDIRKKKHLEDNLKLALMKIQSQNEDLKRLDKLKDEFYEQICHELLTPLISIRGFTELLLNSPNLNEVLHQDVSTILRNEYRLESIINNIVNYSRLREGKVILRKDIFNISEILNEIVEDLETLIKEKKLKIEIEMDLEKEVILDRFQIKRLILNLFNNAIKISDKGGTIKLSSSITRNLWTFSIKTEKLGIAEDDLSRMLRPLLKTNQRSKINENRLGLGFAVCKKIIEIYQGELWAELKGLDRETRFNVELSF